MDRVKAASAAGWGDSARQRLRLRPLEAALRLSAACAARFPPAHRVPQAARDTRGLTLVIPERDAPELLHAALESAMAALAGVAEPWQIVVVANGAPRATYAATRARHPQVEWVHHDAPLGFSAAIVAGLARARHGWTYLMNNDVTLAAGALSAVLDARAPDVFAVASQIFQRSASGRREETGFVDWYEGANGVQPFHAVPVGHATRPSLAASGGAALFRTAPLARYAAATRLYDPFYYEDLEWGVRAWQDGWRVLFCPASHVQHRHRATTARFHDEATLMRIVERNRHLFAARHSRSVTPDAVMRGVCDLPYESQRSLARPAVAAAVFRQRLRTLRAAAPPAPPRLAPAPDALPAQALDVAAASFSYRLRRGGPAGGRPRVLVATPFAVFPPRHGGARRVAGLLAHLRRDHDVILVSDEATLYDARSFAHFDGLHAVRLVQRREDAADRVATLDARMHSHLHAPLVAAVRDAIAEFRPEVIQVEHVEIAGLVALRRAGERWVLGLHDAYGGDDFADPVTAQRFAAQTLPAYDAVTVCSPEDAALVPHRCVAIVPNGSSVALGGYRPSGPGPLMFMGPFRYAPNFEGIRRFLCDAFPGIRGDVPHARLVVLGGDDGARIARDDAAFSQPGVTVLAHREDVGALLDDSALTINPLQAIRGSPVKVIESLSAGRACVSTADGARGFGALGLAGLVVAPDVASMRGPIVRLLDDSAERHRVERPDTTRLAPFQWDACAQRQRMLWGDLLAGA